MITRDDDATARISTDVVPVDMLPLHLDDEPYWALLDRVMAYAVDAGQEAQTVLAPDVALAITPSTFLTDLYVPRTAEGFEQQLAAELLASPSVVCLVGARGTGKTSALHFVQDAIHTAHAGKVRVIIVNLKQHSWLATVPVDDALPQITTCLRKLLSRLFFPRDTARLIAWLLSGPSEHADYREIELTLLSDLHDQSEIVQAETISAGLTRQQRFDALCEVFSKERKLYGDVLRNTFPLLLPAHILLAAHRLLGVPKTVVIYDNIDRLPPQIQPVFLEVLNDQHLALAGICTTAVAIRKENIRSLSPRPGAGGDLITVVMHDEERYPGLLLRPLEAEHVRDVLERRHSFASRTYESFQTVVPPVPESANTDPPPGDRECIDDGAALEIDHASARVHRGVVGQFAGNAIQRLSNGSVRAIAAAYTTFARYLKTLDNRGIYPIPAAVCPGSDDDKHLQTLFYLWLRSQGALVGAALLGSLRLQNDFVTDRAFSEVASATYLLLPCVFNLTQERGGFDTLDAAPTFADVWARMHELGFSLPQIRASIGDLTGATSAASCALEFHRGECDAATLESESTNPLRLTDMGCEFIKVTITRVGFVWGHAYVERHSGMQGKKDYHAMSSRERAQLLHHYLSRVARDHLGLLGTLPREWKERYGSEWLRVYRRRFGIDDGLLIDRIAASAEAFYAPHFASGHNPFGELKRTYRRIAATLETGTSTAELPYAALSQGSRFIKELSDGPSLARP